MFNGNIPELSLFKVIQGALIRIKGSISKLTVKRSESSIICDKIGYLFIKRSKLKLNNEFDITGEGRVKII